MAKKKGYYSIGVVSEMLDVHPQTLRLYEREGLISPKRTGGNTRLYSDDDVRKVEMIQRLTQDLGVNLAGVEIIMRMREKMEEMQTQMDELLKSFLERFSNEVKKWKETSGEALVKVSGREITRIKNDNK
ncbi:MAG: MerR family transcriptional regulator [Candidatus Schekmanbacteria bacterium GWA2_38_9]|uniref:MerR family transcriptional regulator n=1 Tax=Candidatus Schekmanbacteria bacterium RIFCSPLOWO2_12_FULL_38_15 TaxID=1817883 RepID=A0A1F7SNW6_9BACT|nr:MAG: MerR family transcriptional regulator [Candidatus Schekmanbacteria bacterium GWA2_38_9]OGL50210.1 MAG: MerR family transcriptional regulator [Candidatus Schekmanbacteria bacterium RIFCSPLOWO2_02_FULL_38_14]OGL55479.1 MAG: MerR family transcriptional regulator [Candidatus Schekmanbacteria bacterium RIFCSPLOWO2_12_FULL_38_15]